MDRPAIHVSLDDALAILARVACRVADRVADRARTLPRRTVAALAGGAAAYALLYARAARRPRLTLGNEPSLVRSIVDRCASLRAVYWPHPFHVLCGTLGTVYQGTRMPFAAAGLVVPFVEQIALEDGGTVALSWWRCPAAARRTDVAVVLPGLNNSSETGFVRALLQRLDAAGFLAVCYDWRGVGASGPLTSDRPYSADAWRDLDDVFDHVRAEVGPRCRLFLVGQSLGGSILTKFLAETRTPYPVLAAAASVSAPRAFAKANASLDSGVVNKIQNFCMTLPMKLGYALQTDPRAYDGRVLRATSIRDIETALICGPWGHADADAYYRANDASEELHRVGAPYLVLAARDDNVIDFSDSNPCPDASLVAQNPELVACATTKVGGHLSYLDLRGASWADKACVEFFARAAAVVPPVDGDAPPPRRPSATPKAPRMKKRPSVKGMLIGM